MKSFAIAVALMFAPTLCFGQQLEGKEIGVFDFSKGQRDLDILGITAGDIAAAAKEIAEKEGFVFQGDSTTRQQTNERGVASEITYSALLSGSKVMDGISEGLVIFVSSPLTGSRVLSASRTIMYNDNYPAVTSVVDALKTKYANVGFQKDEITGAFVGNRTMLNGALSDGAICTSVLYSLIAGVSTTIASNPGSYMTLPSSNLSELLETSTCQVWSDEKSGYVTSPSGKYSFDARVDTIYDDQSLVKVLNQSFFDESAYLFDEKALLDAFSADIAAQMSAKPEVDAPKL